MLEVIFYWCLQNQYINLIRKQSQSQLPCGFKFITRMLQVPSMLHQWNCTDIQHGLYDKPHGAYVFQIYSLTFEGTNYLAIVVQDESSLVRTDGIVQG